MDKHTPFSKYISQATFLIFLLASAFTSSALATTIMAVSVEEALQGSELVIEGKVTHSETRKAANSRAILTVVTIEVLDVIKGNFSKKSIELPFLGGQYGDQIMQVAEMDYPEVGEHGIYFVETMKLDQAHSLYGWSQGHFLIRKDTDGVPRVTTRKYTPVVGVEDTSPKQTGDLQVSTSRLRSDDQESGDFSHGEAKGLQLERAAPISSAMSTEDFKQSLSRMSKTGQDQKKGGE